MTDYLPYNENVEDYNGTSPTMLTEMYIQRVFHDRYLDDDEDPQFIKTGLTPAMRRGRQLELF